MTSAHLPATKPRIRHGLRFPWAHPPDPGAVQQIVDGIFWLRLPLPMALDHVNAYALDDGPGWTLVDPGIDTPACRAALDAALAGPLSGKPVTRVIVTHHHPDHIGLAGWFQTRGAALWTTRTAWLMARMLQLEVQDRPDAVTLAFWRTAGMDPDIYAKRAAARPFNMADCTAPLLQGYRRLEEGGTLCAGGRDWVVRLGDGHAPDHAMLWRPDLVLGGDQLLPSISANLGVYPREPDADPVAEWIGSAAALEPFASNDQLVLPGHKLPFYGLPLRLRQMIDNHHGALDRLRRHLAQGPHTACECFPVLFKRKINEDTYGLAMAEAVAHLNHLWHRGEVGRTARPDGAWIWHLV